MGCISAKMETDPGNMHITESCSIYLQCSFLHIIKFVGHAISILHIVYMHIRTCSLRLVLTCCMTLRNLLDSRDDRTEWLYPTYSCSCTYTGHVDMYHHVQGGRAGLGACGRMYSWAPGQRLALMSYLWLLILLILVHSAKLTTPEQTLCVWVCWKLIEDAAEPYRFRERTSLRRRLYHRRVVAHCLGSR